MKIKVEKENLVKTSGKSYPLYNIIIIVVISIIFGAISVDYVKMNNRLNYSINYIRSRQDSLSIYVNNKLPIISKNNSLQKNQLDKFNSLGIKSK